MTRWRESARAAGARVERSQGSGVVSARDPGSPERARGPLRARAACAGRRAGGPADGRQGRGPPRRQHLRLRRGHGGAAVGDEVGARVAWRADDARQLEAEQREAWWGKAGLSAPRQRGPRQASVAFWPYHGRGDASRHGRAPPQHLQDQQQRLQLRRTPRRAHTRPRARRMCGSAQAPTSCRPLQSSGPRPAAASG